MSELNFSLLEHLPEGIILMENGLVSAINARGRELLPALTPGSPLPEGLLPAENTPGNGFFQLNGQRCQFSVSGDARRCLLFFSPIEEEEFSYLSGAAQQLRRALAPMMQGLAPHVGPNGDKQLKSFVTQAFYAIFRVVYNAEFLADPSVISTPVTVDLVSLCSRLTMEVGGLLKELKVGLVFQCTLPVLLISGDPVLLRRMLLELITNSIRVTPSGQDIRLELAQRGRQAILTLRDGGSQTDSIRLMAALSGQPRAGIPHPGEGAGMGLAVAQRIVGLHRGALLAMSGAVILALPTGAAGTGVSMHTPPTQDDGGLDPLLLGLCDLMPSHIFEDVGLD